MHNILLESTVNEIAGLSPTVAEQFEDDAVNSIYDVSNTTGISRFVRSLLCKSKHRSKYRSIRRQLEGDLSEADWIEIFKREICPTLVKLYENEII